MSYILNTPDDQRAMLEAIGVKSVDELFDQIPAELRLRRELKIPPVLTEIELTSRMEQLAARNQPAGRIASFLGGGSYDHFVPAVVDTIAGRGEFYTSYTPYQPEAAQGNLQVAFEYQTLICQLTGMEVSNASLYDGGSAAVEGVLMSLSATRRARVVTTSSVHPEYRECLATYLANMDTQLVTVPTPNGAVNVEELARAITDDTACVLIQHPNFFGCLEDVQSIVKAAHERGALVVMAVDPISLGLLKRPGDLGVDIVVAEGQSLGTPLQYGGPYLGIMACREQFVRRLPGRIAGQTVDRRGRRCWVLTLQTREQHIRREKATSNICTNQGLLALRATVYLALLGPQGLRETAEACTHKAHYAHDRLLAGGRMKSAFAQPFFKEFVVRDSEGRAAEVIEESLDANIMAGVPLAPWYPELADCLLVAVTEKRTKTEIDRLVSCLAGRSSRSKVIHA